MNPLLPEAARPTLTLAGMPVRRIFCRKPVCRRLEMPRQNGHHIDRRPDPQLWPSV